MSSTAWFVAVVAFAVGAMTLWLLLDWLARAGERPFRPRREAVETPQTRERAAPVETTTELEVDFDYLDELRRPVRSTPPERTAGSKKTRDPLASQGDASGESSGSAPVETRGKPDVG